MNVEHNARSVLRRAGMLVAALIATLALTACGAGPSGQASANDDGTEQGSRADERALWDNWARLWNGDYAQAERIISPDFRLHAALSGGASDDSIRGPEGLTQFVKESRAPYTDLEFTTPVGSLIDGRYVIGRWKATGPYKGGVPGAQAEPGTVVTFHGTDILRLEDGKVVEYWLSADTESVQEQLQVQPQQK